MTGLIGWWPLHENSGSTARDLSGNGNHGTLNGDVTQGVAGKGGLTAYSFDGSDDNIDIPNIGDIDIVTLSAWVYFSSVDNTWDAIINNDWSSGGFHFQRRPSDLTDNPNTIQLASKDGGSIHSQETVTENQWHHLAGVINTNQDEMELYINGQISSSGSAGTSPYDGSTANIGAWNDGGTLKRHHQGKIQDFRAYNRALSPQEIQTLYKWGSGDYTRKSLHDGSDSGAISRWKFESGNVTADSWGSNMLTDNTSAGTTTDAIRGTAKSFDGSDDYLNAGMTSFTPNDLTVSTWFYDSDTAGNRRNAVSKATSSSREWALLRNSSTYNNGIQFEVIDDLGQYVAVRDRSSPTNDWMHVVGISRGGATELYINGTLRGTTDKGGSSVGSGTGEVNIGRRKDVGKYWIGALDDVRIYNRALSPSEVFQLYQWGTRGRDMRKLTVNARGDQ